MSLKKTQPVKLSMACKEQLLSHLTINTHVNIFVYIITQIILALWLVLAYDLLEDRRTIDVIITKS